jgi:hypothetical protein
MTLQDSSDSSWSEDEMGCAPDLASSHALSDNGTSPSLGVMEMSPALRTTQRRRARESSSMGAALGRGAMYMVFLRSDGCLWPDHISISLPRHHQAAAWMRAR